MLATLTELDEEALVQILKEPKNSLVKQYQKLFDLEKVRLRFTDGSLVAIAKEALKRNTGARGLRAIMENSMLDIMYEVPSQPNVQEVVINEDVIYQKEKPIIVYEQELKRGCLIFAFNSARYTDFICLTGIVCSNYYYKHAQPPRICTFTRKNT